MVSVNASLSRLRSHIVQVAHSAGQPRQEARGQRPSFSPAASHLTIPLPAPYLPGIAHYGFEGHAGPRSTKHLASTAAFRVAVKQQLQHSEYRHPFVVQ
ncbi:hypothetical protein FIBSPDRAFT_5122 [Athelia psychrophila]|uniref:Uncharacterized protein n=1 Tax=Athelia psychrophila TaxID=1759441 RepID=A0A166X0V1_9AGAM|nr:hypothetical protein FIBSPDRAFT_5122 [Fibularhizoctonia sp. CBS 109695]